LLEHYRRFGRVPLLRPAELRPAIPAATRNLTQRSYIGPPAGKAESQRDRVGVGPNALIGPLKAPVACRILPGGDANSADIISVDSPTSGNYTQSPPTMSTPFLGDQGDWVLTAKRAPGTAVAKQYIYGYMGLGIPPKGSVRW